MNDIKVKYLFDINAAIDRMYIHMNGIETIKDYTRSVTVKSAVEREFEIIGEAVKCLLNVTPDIQITATQKIIAMRNRIIHGYDNIDDNLILQVFQDNIPTLKTEVKTLLEGEK